MAATDPAITNSKNNITAANKNGQKITSLEIVPVTESDVFEIAGLEAQAFRSHVATQVMFGTPSLEKQEFRASQLRASLAGAGPNALSVKIEMEGRMVAFAHWTFNVDADWDVKAKEKEEREKKEKEEKEKERQNGDCGGDGEKGAKSDFAPGTNIGLCKEFFGWIDDVRKRRMGGVPNAVLHLLVTHPEFQGRGLGSALMSHGLAIADEKNLPAWLEASPSGYGLYKRFGFYDVETQQIDLAKFGGEGQADIFGMFRPNGDDSVKPNDA